MSRPPRKLRDPAVLRGRFRTLLFAVLALLAGGLGHIPAAAVALVAVAVGLWSVRMAATRRGELTHTFVVVDWLLLACVIALSGGAESWLLASVPLLAMGQLAGAPRSEWPYLLSPALLLLVVLAIADPSLGGSRAGGVAKVLVLTVGGWVAAARLRQPRARRRRPPRVDGTTGFYTGSRLPELLAERCGVALAVHRPLSILYLRLDHYQDARDFLGAQRSEQLVASVSRRIERRLALDDLAFRVSDDSFVAVLCGRSPAEARGVAGDIARDVRSSLIGGRRQTLATGTASFPTLRRIPDLLAAARTEALGVETSPAARQAADTVAAAN